MNFGGSTACGPREVNEDSFYLYEFDEDAKLSGGIRAFVLVSDGMGGYQGGDVASKLVVTCAKSYVEQLHEMAHNNWVELDASSALREMTRNAHEAILAHERANAETAMGATFVGAFVGLTYAWIGHIGDSRAYLIHRGQAQQITVDHSHVGRLLSKGVITEEEAQSHPDRNRIERALGFSEAGCDIDEIELDPTDALVLCSDGVYTVLDAEAISSCVSKASDAQEAAERLVTMALRRRTDDNSTAVVVMGADRGVAKTSARILPATARRQMESTEVRRIGGSASARRADDARLFPWATVLPVLLLVVLTGLMVVLFMQSGTSSGQVSDGATMSEMTERQSWQTDQQGTVSRLGQEGQDTAVANTSDASGLASDGSDAEGAGRSDVQKPDVPSASDTTGYKTYVTHAETLIKYVDNQGLAQAFTQEPLYMSNSLSIGAGVSVRVSENVNEYGRIERSYQTLPDDYVRDLKRDVSRYREGVTGFDSALSRLVGTERYLSFISELAEYDASEVEDVITHLIVDELVSDGTDGASAEGGWVDYTSDNSGGGYASQGVDGTVLAQ